MELSRGVLAGMFILCLTPVPSLGQGKQVDRKTPPGLTLTQKYVKAVRASADSSYYALRIWGPMEQMKAMTHAPMDRSDAAGVPWFLEKSMALRDTVLSIRRRRGDLDAIMVPPELSRVNAQMITALDSLSARSSQLQEALDQCASASRACSNRFFDASEKLDDARTEFLDIRQRLRKMLTAAGISLDTLSPAPKKASP